MAKKKKSDSVKNNRPSYVTLQPKELQLVAQLTLQAIEKGWSFIAVRDFRDTLGITSDRVLNIFHLLKEGGVMNYDTMPFDNPEKRDILNRNDEPVDERGAITFFSVPRDGVDTGNLKRQPAKASAIKTLGQISASQEAARNYMESVGYRDLPNYDTDERKLVYGDVVVNIASGLEESICKKVFVENTNYSAPLDEIDIDDEDIITHVAARKKRYNAVYAINGKYEARTGLKLFKIKDSCIIALHHTKP